MTRTTDLERRVICAFVAMSLSLLPALSAAAATNTSPATAPATSTTSTTHSVTTPNLTNLDLNSRNKTVSSPFGGTIREGAGSVKFNPGDLVTPAQALALSQLVTTGTQSLILNTLGTAIGGTFKIAGSSIDALVIPRGVTGFDNFSNGNALNLAGSLSNSGKLYLFSTDNAFNTAAIKAQNIYNNAGGLLSSVLPSSLLASLGGIPTLNLNLSAINNIVNAGIIRSSGTLSLIAGNSIINALPSGVTGPAPLMQAASTLNLSAANIVNSGLISSLNSNINLAGINASSLAVNNTAGTMSALLGNINVRDALFSAKTDFNLVGGNLLSKQLNVFTGDGVSNITANQISGLVNINAGVAHVTVDTGNLNLGEMNITGDPTYYNKGGDVLISSDFTFGGQDLAIVASRNIITTVNGKTITTHPATTGNAGVITLVAGAQFAIPSTAPPLGPNDTTTTVSIFSGSATGGKIDLATHPIAALNASGNGGNGGNILMVAYKGSGAGSGTISLPSNVVISSTGSASKTSGDVTLIAGATSGTGISIGGIDTSSGGGTGGAIKLTTATPNIVVNPLAPSPGITVDIVDGGFTQNSALFAPGATTAASIALGTVGTTSASDFTVLTNGAFTTGTGGNITAGGTAGHLNGGVININAASVVLHNLTASGNTADGNGGTIGVLSAGALALNGVINANGGTNATTGNGGTISITGGTISGTNNIVIDANASGTGHGGHILMGSTGALNVAQGTNGNLNVSANGGSVGSAAGDGGFIQLNSGSNITVDPNGLSFGPQGTNGVGGTLILDAGFKSPAGTLLVNGGLSANGKGSGSGGNIQLYSNSTTVFDVEGTATKNGITGPITANGGTTAGANGGSIYIQNSGTGGIKVDPAKLQVQASAAGGAGGAITIYAGTSTQNLSAAGIDIDFNRTIPAQIGAGFITSNLATKGAVTIVGGPGATLDASGSAAGGSGGTIGIIGTTVTNTAGALSVKADGVNTGNGGAIYIGTGGTNADITMGSATNTLSLSAHSGNTDGNGGTIALKATQGSINIDTTTGALSFGPAAGGTGNGGVLQLAAGDSKSTTDRNVFISGPAIQDLNGGTGGSGGQLFVVSNSSKAFTFGGAAAGGNGFVVAPTAIRGATSNAAGGTMLFSNYHRNLAGAAFDANLLDNAVANVTSAAVGSGGTVALMDLASDNVEAKAAVTINVPSTAYNLSGTGTGSSGGNGGNLILEANSFTGFTNSGVAVSVNGADIGNGGKVVLRETSTTSTLSLNPAASAGKLVIQAQGGSAGSAAGNGGAIYVGAANIDASNLPSFKVGPLGNNGNGGALAFIAQNQLTLDTASTYNLTGVGTGNGGSIAVAGSNSIVLHYNVDGVLGGSMAANSLNGDVTLTSLGTASQTVNTSSAAKGLFTLTSAGGLFLAGAITSLKDLTINATGNILTGPRQTNKAVLTAPKVSLTATGTIGNFDQSNIDSVIDERVLTSTPHMIVNAGQSAYISNKGALSLDDAQANNTNGTLMIATSGNLTVPALVGSNPISANTINLRTAGLSNGTVTLNRQIGTSTAVGSTVQISADGKGNIVQGAGPYNIKADSVLLDYESFVPGDPTQPAPIGNIGTAAAPIRVEGVKHPSVVVNNTTWLNNPIDPAANTVNLGALTFGKGIYIAVNGDADLSNFFDVEGTLSLTATKNVATNSTGNIIVTAQLATLGGGKSNTIILNADNNFYLAKLAAIGFSDSLNVSPGPPPVAFLEPGSTVKISAGGSILSTIYSANATDARFRGVVRGHDVSLTAGTGSIGLADSDPNGGLFPKVSAAATNLNLTATNGSAYVNGEDIQSLSFLPINLSKVSLKPAGSTLELFSFRPITVSSAVAVDKVDLEVYQGLVGDITLKANVGTTALGGSTKISADGSSNILQTSGTILSPLVILGGMTTGNIGSAAHPINTAASELVVGTQYDPTNVNSTAGPHIGDTYVNNVLPSNASALTLKGGGTVNLPTHVLQSGGVLSVKNSGSIIIPAGYGLDVSSAASGTAMNGVASTVTIPFSVASASQLQVYDYNNSTNTSSLVPATHYSVNLQTSTVTFNQTFIPANNHSIIVVRTTSPTISLTATNGDITLADNIIANHNVIDARVVTDPGDPNHLPLPIPPTVLNAMVNTTGVTSTINLTAGGGGNIITTGGVIKGDNVNISTNTGSVGTLANPLNISSPNGLNTTNISASTTGTASNIYITATSASTITNAVATNVHLLAKGGNMTLNGTIGKVGTLSVPTSVSISNDSTESILAGTKVNVLGSNLSLAASGGTLGSGTARIKLSPQTSLTVNADSAFLQTTAATNLGNLVSVTNTFDLLSAGAITGTVNAPTVTLKTTAGGIGTGTSPQTRLQIGPLATALSLTSATDVFVNDGSSAGSSLTGSSKGKFDVLTAQNLTVTNVSASSLITVNNTGGLITLTGVNKAPTITLATNNQNITGTIAATTLNAAAGTGNLNLSNAGALTENSATGNNISISTTGTNAALTVKGALNASSVTLNANGNLSIANQIGGAGSVVSLNTTGTNATLTVSSAVTGSSITMNSTGNLTIGNQIGGAGSTVSLSTTGAGTITRTATGMVSGDSISLKTAGGAIGTSSMAINTTGTGATPLLMAGLTGGSGNVYLNNVAANGTTFSQLAGTSFPGALTITDSSPQLTLSGAIGLGTVNTKSTSNLIVTEKTGNIAVTNNGTSGDAQGILVTGGSATVQALNPNATITFNTNSQLKTNVAATTAATDGVVKVVVGPTLPTTGTSLTGGSQFNVSFNAQGSNVILGAGSNFNPIGAGTGPSTVVAHGRPVFLSSVNPFSIILNASNVIADPPVSTGAVAAGTHLTFTGVGSAQAPALQLQGNGAAQAPALQAQGNGSAQAPAPQIQGNGSAQAPALQAQGNGSAQAPALQAQGNGSAQAPALQAQGNGSAQIAQLVTTTIPLSVNSSATARDTMHPRVLTGGVSLYKKTANNRSGVAHDSSGLQAGGNIVAPDHDIAIATPFGPLKVAAHAIVLAILNEDGLGIYDLHDEHLGDVSLDHIDGAIELHPGQHAFVTRSSKDYEALNPLTFVAHRNLKTNGLGQDTLFTSEFSITSALATHGPLSGLLRSNNADERRIISRLMKDAAILMQTKAAQGQYKRIAPAGLSYAE